MFPAGVDNKSAFVIRLDVFVAKHCAAEDILAANREAQRLTEVEHKARL